LDSRERVRLRFPLSASLFMLRSSSRAYVVPGIPMQLGIVNKET